MIKIIGNLEKGSRRAVQVLIKELNTEYMVSKSTDIGGKSLGNPILELDFKTEAARSLGKIGTLSEEAIPDLARLAIAGKSKKLRFTAIEAVEKIDIERGRKEYGTKVPQIIEGLQSENEGYRISSAIVLTYLDMKIDTVLSVLLEVLEEPRREDWKHVVRAVGRLAAR